MPNPRMSQMGKLALKAGGLVYDKYLYNGFRVINKTGSDIAADKLVCITGFDTTSGRPKVVLADADATNHQDIYVALNAIDNNDEGVVFKGGKSTVNLDTSSFSAAGDPVYLSTTAGAFSATLPMGVNAKHIKVGYIVTVSATVGEIFWHIETLQQYDARWNRTSVQTSGDLIGAQFKPRQGAASSGTVYGFQASGQISDTFALSGSGSVIGGHVDVYLRGTGAGAIGGDVRGMQIELTTDDAGTRNITGYVTALRIRKAFSAGTVTGNQSAIRIEAPEAQTNSETYNCLFDLTSTVGSGTSTVWTDGAVSSATNAGCLGIMVNGNKRYINLFSGTPA